METLTLQKNKVTLFEFIKSYLLFGIKEPLFERDQSLTREIEL
jgi:hypothetical protein